MNFLTVTSWINSFLYFSNMKVKVHEVVVFRIRFMYTLISLTLLFLQTYIVTDTVQKIAESFECKPVEGMLSHQLNQNVIDGEKTIIQNPNEAQRKEHDKFDFELHEVFAIGNETNINKQCSQLYKQKFQFFRCFNLNRRRPWTWKRCQSDHLQKDGRNLYVKNEEFTRIFQRCEQKTWRHAFQHQRFRIRNEGQDGRSWVRHPQTCGTFPGALWERRYIEIFHPICLGKS